MEQVDYRKETQTMKQAKAESKSDAQFERFRKSFPGIKGACHHLMQAILTRRALDEQQIRLIKLGIAIGTMRATSVSNNVHKLVALGFSVEQLKEVVRVATTEVGLTGAFDLHCSFEEALGTRYGEEDVAGDRSS